MLFMSRCVRCFVDKWIVDSSDATVRFGIYLTLFLIIRIYK